MTNGYTSEKMASIGISINTLEAAKAGLFNQLNLT